jgi:hypothetical protein
LHHQQHHHQHQQLQQQQHIAASIAASIAADQSSKKKRRNRWGDVSSVAAAPVPPILSAALSAALPVVSPAPNAALSSAPTPTATTIVGATGEAFEGEQRQQQAASGVLQGQFNKYFRVDKTGGKAAPSSWMY